jgi:hypothetical protein
MKIVIGILEFKVVEQPMGADTWVYRPVKQINSATFTRYRRAWDEQGALVLLAHYWTTAGRAIATRRVGDEIGVIDNGIERRWRVSRIERQENVTPQSVKVYARGQVTFQTCFGVYGTGRIWVVCEQVR